MVMMLNSLRIKIFEIIEGSTMAGTCEIWRVGVFIAASYNILKNMYNPLWEVEDLICR